MGVFPLDKDDPTQKIQMPIASFEGRNGEKPKAVAVIRRCDAKPRGVLKFEPKTESVAQPDDLISS